MRESAEPETQERAVVRWRSVLPVPGHQEDRCAKAHDRGADHVFFDLEDAVPVDAKESARAAVWRHLRPGDGLRINPGFGIELRLASTLGAIVWFPKIRSLRDLDGVVATRLAVVPIIETAFSLEFLPAILSRLPRVAGVAFGAMDFCASMGVGNLSHLATWARCRVATAAAAIGVQALDSPCLSLASGAMEVEVEHAISCGFTGKGCMTPRHIEACARFEERPQPYPVGAEPIFRVGEQIVGPAMTEAHHGPR